MCVTSSPYELFFLSSQRTWLFFQVQPKLLLRAAMATGWLLLEWPTVLVGQGLKRFLGCNFISCTVFYNRHRI